MSEPSRRADRGSAGELSGLTPHAEGALYARDLQQLEASRRATIADVARARALAGYLVALHREKIPGPPELYHRAVRALMNGDEGLLGIADSFPDDAALTRARLLAIEHRTLEWRARLRARAHRLSRTHGDFHPSKLLFRQGLDLTVLDASPGAMGDPADDLAALTISYVFEAVVHPASWREGISPLWLSFWADYLAGSGDVEVLEVLGPFFAHRALALASPSRYPQLTEAQRGALLTFAEQVMAASMFDPLDTSFFAPE
jgi:Phosphotransferase enzyme family